MTPLEKTIKNLKLLRDWLYENGDDVKFDMGDYCSKKESCQSVRCLAGHSILVPELSKVMLWKDDRLMNGGDWNDALKKIFPVLFTPPFEDCATRRNLDWHHLFDADWCLESDHLYPWQFCDNTLEGGLMRIENFICAYEK